MSLPVQSDVEQPYLYSRLVTWGTACTPCLGSRLLQHFPFLEFKSSSHFQPHAFFPLPRSKRQAQDRPMSLWISSLKQLEPAKHLFTPLLWDFMEAAWPSPISLVIPRGEEMLLIPSFLESFGFEIPRAVNPCNATCSIGILLSQPLCLD